jgi:hypothetical protein
MGIITGKPKVLIVTGCETNGDTEWQNVFDLSLKSKYNYANIHGYDLYIVKNFPIDPYGIFNKSEIGFLRTVLTLEINKHSQANKQYDYIFWLDADTIITNPSYNIEYFVDGSTHQDNCYYASYDWGSNAKNFGLFNNGNWIIKTGDSAHSLYTAFLEIAKNFPNEQEALNFLHRTKEYNRFFSILEKHFLNSVPNYEHLVESRNNQTIDTPWQIGHFLCHFSGLSNTQRLYIINKYYKNFI